jgi:catechol 2,3-dioxygenase-like lactoylglutathione lyase family enzyme
MPFPVSLLSAALHGAAPIPRVDSVAIVVRDVVAERRFYSGVLGFTDLGSRAIPGRRIERLALGNERLDLVRYERAGAPITPSARSNDRDFQHIAIIVSDMRRAWARVERADIRTVSAAPQVLPAWNSNAGGIAAVYFRDPEGHPLELLQFPAGKGEARWHASAPLFLGIDHTAIAVTDSATSTRFYKALGLAVRGHSDNYGIEQARLSGVRDAHVHITGLRFAEAPGVEFLQYVRPLSHAPPERARLFDAIATRTIVVEPDVATTCRRFRGGIAILGGCVLRDPDGHLVEVRSATPNDRT